jgi:hypothetical protein
MLARSLLRCSAPVLGISRTDRAHLNKRLEFPSPRPLSLSRTKMFEIQIKEL